jgi:hypothetical protein
MNISRNIGQGHTNMRLSCLVLTNGVCVCISSVQDSSTPLVVLVVCGGTRSNQGTSVVTDYYAIMNV